MKHIPFTAILFIMAPALCQAQKLVDSRDQATGWYVPVNINVTAEGGKVRGVEVLIYKDNTLIQTIQPKEGKFTLNLDLDNAYTFTINKEGYLSKSVYMDTHLPKDKVQYSEYTCYANLEAADKFSHSDMFYTDFPGAIVRWDPSLNAFAPSSQYLTDIQSKIAMLQAQMSPE